MSAVKAPPRALMPLLRQFGRPAGTLGWVAGRMMAKRNGATNRHVVALLDVGPEDRVLDVGCGPGLAVEAAGVQAVHGFVTGLDASPVMVAQAERRNQPLLAAGRGAIVEGRVEHLPFPDGQFTRAMSVNSLQFWDPVEAGLAELRRVLAPGGRLALGLRRWRPDAGRTNPSSSGFTAERVGDVVLRLRTAGFRDVTSQTDDVGAETITVVLATR